MKEKSYFFTHKFLPVLSVFLLCFFIFCTSCFASYQTEFTYNDTSYTVPDYSDLVSGYKYLLFLDDSDWVSIYLMDDNSEVYQNCDNGAFYIKALSLYYCKPGSTWKLSPNSISNTSFTWGATSKHIFYSDVSVLKAVVTYNPEYSLSLTDEVVFQGAPVTVEQVTIPAIQQVEEIPQAMGEVLKILIPIGLIVLSIGFVIYLMRLVILRVQ